MAGRPRAEPKLTPQQVIDAAALGCTDEEIALLAGVSEATVKRHFEPQLKEGRGSLRRSLRKAQVARALDGSDTMLIWLGKQYLGQRDKQDIEHSGNQEKPIAIVGFDPLGALAALAPGSMADRDEPGDD